MKEKIKDLFFSKKRAFQAAIFLMEKNYDARYYSGYWFVNNDSHRILTCARSLDVISFARALGWNSD